MTAADLKTFRAKLGLTQTELAEKLGMTRDAIARMEGGTRTVTKVTELALRYLVLVGSPPKRGK